MTKHRGQASIDTITATLGPMIMISIYLQAVWSITQEEDGMLRKEETIEKLVSISDNILRFNAERNGKITRTNIVDIEKSYDEWAREKYGIEHISIGTNKGNGECITRYAIVRGEAKRIYFCSDAQ